MDPDYFVYCLKPTRKTLFKWKWKNSELSALAHVVRCFEDDNITHVDGSVNPARDVEVINLELILADLESVTKRITDE